MGTQLNAKETLERIRKESEKRRRARREGRKRGELSESLEEKLRSCNPLQLKRVKKICDEYLADHRLPPDDFECGQRYTKKILVSVPVKNTRYLLELRPCGKDCQKCPHGPYLYAYHRDGAIIKQFYYRKDQLHTAPRKIRIAIAPFLKAGSSQRQV
jgi:hypothetical protein